MTAALSLAVSMYRCEPCGKRGIEVRALVRMISQCAIVDGDLVGEELWCCPVCHRPKFTMKKKPVTLTG